jgi:hypothetical protein
MNDSNKSSKVTIWVAVIGATATIAAAMISKFGNTADEKNRLFLDKNFPADSTKDIPAHAAVTEKPSFTAPAPAIPGKYPFASTRYLYDSELARLSQWELKIMRNEIYARRGYLFHKNPEMMRYFLSQEWYNNIPNKIDDGEYIFNKLLTDIEKANINLIKKYEY